MIKTIYEFVSTDGGNCKNADFTIVRGQYSTDNKKTYEEVGEEDYPKPSSTSVLLTTGATERNSVLNIYDLAVGTVVRPIPTATLVFVQFYGRTKKL